MLRTAPSLARTARAFVGAGAILVLLVGCTAAAGEHPTPPSSLSPSTADTATASPALQPEGTAEDNLPYFRAIAEGVWASEQRAEGRAYIDALVAGGFDRTAMQVTPDQTTVGNPVESLQFSVRWGEEPCLVGQVGPSTGQVVAVAMPQLAEGRCLVGTTRPIDW